MDGCSLHNADSVEKKQNKKNSNFVIYKSAHNVHAHG